MFYILSSLRLSIESFSNDIDDMILSKGSHLFF